MTTIPQFTGMEEISMSEWASLITKLETLRKREESLKYEISTVITGIEAYLLEELNVCLPKKGRSR